MCKNILEIKTLLAKNLFKDVRKFMGPRLVQRFIFALRRYRKPVRPSVV